MIRLLPVVLVLSLGASSAAAQSLFVTEGQRAVDASLSWAVGPASTGWEWAGAVSVDGRVDLGFGIGRYTPTGALESTVEYSPFVRYYLFKEVEDGAAANLALHGQYVRREGWWSLLGGATVSKRLPLGPALTVYPFLGVNYGTETYTFEDAPASEREAFLTRQAGVHALVPIGERAWLRLTFDEHAFRRETFRAARAALVVRF